MRLRDRPWKLAILIAFATIAVAHFGIDLFDGQVTLRRRGTVDAATRPVRFALVAAGWLLGALTVGFGWVGLVAEWNVDYRSRTKPEMIDPDRIRPF
jgi:thiosulfate reductase cytochrome b subunit